MEMMILKLMFKKQDGEALTALTELNTDHAVGAWVCSNEPSGSIKRVKFLDQIRAC
jgi:hypothetical protein